MCGIAGYFGRFEPRVLSRMNSEISHRGPDDQGEWFDVAHGVGFAHRRLSIIDLSSAGHQPMWDAQRRAVITFNGEIYNYLELRSELIAAGYKFNSNCDTEVIINLYLREGAGCLSRLDGIFSFALWDTEKRELLIARDGLGVKPLYYSVSSLGFAFASELKSLLRLGGIDKSIDADGLYSYITFLYSPGPNTMLKSVKKILPGSAMVLRADGTNRQWRFYELPYDQPISGMSESEGISQTEFFIRKAVERQMIADVPVGAFLSGGLDSSSVAVFAQQCMGSRRLECFTIGFDDAPGGLDGSTPDLPYARKVASHIGVNLHTIQVSPRMGDDLEDMVYQLDEPQADPAALGTLYISRIAKNNGIKVLLSGAGGDDIFTGYRRHRALMLEKYWSWLPKSCRRLIKEASSGFSKNTSLGRRVAKAFQYADLNGDDRIVGYFHWLSPGSTFGLLDRDWMNSSGYSSANQMTAALGMLPGEVAPLNRMLFLDSKYFLADHNLNYTDKMSMACGVEVRVPLLDRNLVDFAARLPLDFKQRGSVGKWVFKRAMEPYLPRDVIYRPKTGFGVPLRHWLQGNMGAIVGDYLSEESIRRRGIYNAKAVQQMILDDRLGKVDAAYSILALACIEIWIRRFVD